MRNSTTDFENCSTHDGVSVYQDQQWEQAQSQNLQDLAPHGMNLSDYPVSEIMPPLPSIISQSSIQTPYCTSSRTKSWIQIASPLASAPNVASHTLPRVFTPFPCHLAAADVAYLQSRDALTLPSEPMQIALLKAYVEFVNPTMPLLDLEEFLSAVKYGMAGPGSVARENMGKKQIALLLFQAVMFAGAGFVSLKILKEEGFQSRETAKTVLFSRVRVCVFVF